MRIAEMEAHHEEYIGLEAQIRSMVADHHFPAVFQTCMASFPHIVPAIKFRKKRGIEPEMPRLLSFRTITKYGPPLFEHAVLGATWEFVKGERTLATHENTYVEAAEAAFDDEEAARLLWNHLIGHPGFLQRNLSRELGLSQEVAVSILEVWEEFGIVARRKESNTYILTLRSRLDAVTLGKCSTCGVRGKGRKEHFLRRMTCKKCGNEDFYHISYEKGNPS